MQPRVDLRKYTVSRRGGPFSWRRRNLEYLERRRSPSSAVRFRPEKLLHSERRALAGHLRRARAVLSKGGAGALRARRRVNVLFSPESEILSVFPRIRGKHDKPQKASWRTRLPGRASAPHAVGGKRRQRQ